MTEKIILAGFGGQGMMLLGKLLAQTAMTDGKYVTYFPSYGTEVRGGTAVYHLIISTEEIFSPLIEVADTLIIMNQPSYQKFKGMLKHDGLLILNSSMSKSDNLPHVKTYNVPATEIASKLGSVLVSNIVMLGAYIAIKKLFSTDHVLDQLRIMLKQKKGELFLINKQAFESGMQVIESLL
ncbi:MAG: 2-oxoacid:ferredoxin oxidoreductase subunit gamma [Candidatus Jettenia sp.]|uniref:Pyruvate:ferredoxin and related 2-oxoacid:ferredoxin oxidoreductases gamma subunit n=1 Tax=Candidatus Jettenia caeni TaxID=247490 RepID=I3IQV5_9BACT|nr:2-oxoacid:acceptor oxidoreductase family protein [Candidatus Jettenia sp. AMX1]MBC6928186.1 2-oxoacid:ferredoxin oxidoreductase subunit gamma [Candidatus Jettenia sp.]NUN23941.1 2-oxoacid:acceptor oxidoreductase family protein [Candidatus Jettenia caeni]KAA0249007.1 MAG: 2-oxoacid:ferredoxin oxidoreductase subunit gamma [Candidatus Jettenia sp. AMX1]MCE7879575.1 2-oxoacid:ferredoxin oxidoreductase subunit gamma [Candidatus Jettenia sp. AMX1]MCQ3926934.1 2-oxoacid:ferredoxin oxidoreductase s